MRFDDSQRRQHRLREDRFSLVSDIWDSFISNCQRCYIPNTELTIDEQLFPCKTRCPFTQYMASKPDKFGIKFWFLVDNDSKYLFNARPYLGRDPTRRPGTDVPLDVCMKLMQPLYGFGYNVTTDNYFSSLKLANALAEKKTTLVGTIRRQRREVPDGEALMKQRSLYDSEVYSTTMNGRDITSLTIYKAKKNKTIYLLSTMHPSVSIDVQHSKKLPETISMYNRTKVGVDVLDQMSRYFTCKSGTRRWPMAVFFNILDISSINAWILYKEVTGQEISRREFLLQLVMEMCRPNETQTQVYLPVQRDVAPRHHCQVSENGQTCKNKSNNMCVQCSFFCCGRHIGSKSVTVFCVNCNN